MPRNTYGSTTVNRQRRRAERTARRRTIVSRNFWRFLLLACVVLVPLSPVDGYHVNGGRKIAAWSKPIVAPVFKTFKPNNARKCFQHQTAQEAAYCHYYTEVGYLNNRNRKGPPFFVRPASREGQTWAITDTKTGEPANPVWIRKFYKCPPGSVPGEWWNSALWVTYSSKLFDPDHHISFCIVTDASQDLDKTLGCRTGDGTRTKLVGNPCDVATGNKFQAETDYLSASVQPLNIRRYYNSRANEGSAVPFMGKKWRLNLYTPLVYTATSRVASIRVKRQDGQIIAFHKPSSQPEWRSEGDLEISIESVVGGWLLRHGDGATERFDTSGRPLERTAPSGLSTTYTYDSEGRLQSVSNTFGHVVELRYNEDNYLTEIQLPDGQLIHYDYAGGFATTQNLIRVTYADGTYRNYHYEDARYPNHLTGITDENGIRYATFTYNDKGLVISSEHPITDNAVPQQRYLLDYLD